MAKSKVLMAAEAKIAALEARIALATEVWRNQKARIQELEAALNTRGVKTAPAPVPQPIVTEFTKSVDGSRWRRTRTGNRSVMQRLN